MLITTSKAIPPTAIEYNTSEILKKYDEFLVENVDRAYINKINNKKYVLRIADYLFTIVLRENQLHTYIEVFDIKHQEYCVKGVVRNSGIKQKLQSDEIYFNKALNDLAFRTLGIKDDSSDDSEESNDKNV